MCATGDGMEERRCVVSGRTQLRGEVVARAYVHKREPMSAAVDALKVCQLCRPSVTPHECYSGSSCVQSSSGSTSQSMADTAQVNGYQQEPVCS